MTHYNPPVRSAIVAALQQHGPMTCAEITEMLDWPTQRAHGAISTARARYPGQFFRVVGWRRTGTRSKDASIYAAEPGPDAEKPRTNTRKRRRETQSRYRDKNRALINTRARAIRDKASGKITRHNPWAQLATPHIRGLMCSIERRQHSQPGHQP